MAITRPLLILLAAVIQLSLSEVNFCSNTFNVRVFDYYTSIASRRLNGNINLNEGPRIEGTDFSVPSFEFSGSHGLRIKDPRIINGIRNATCTSNELTLYGKIFFKINDTGGPVIELVSNNETFIGLVVCKLSNEIIVSYKHLGNLTFETVPYKFSLGKWYKFAVILSGNVMSVYVNCEEVVRKNILLPDYCPSNESSVAVLIGESKLSEDQLLPCTNSCTASLEGVGVWCGIKGISEQCPNIPNGVLCPICGPHLSLIKKFDKMKEEYDSMDDKLSKCNTELNTCLNSSCSQTKHSCLIEERSYKDGFFAKKRSGEICFCRDGNAVCIDPDNIPEPTDEMVIVTPSNTPEPVQGNKCAEYTTNGQTFTLNEGEIKYLFANDKCTVVECKQTMFGYINDPAVVSCNNVSSNCASLTSTHNRSLAICCGKCSSCDFVTCPLGSTCEASGHDHSCQCSNGFEVSSDGTTCQDRDECALGKQQNGHNCPDISKCNNTIGSFECICPSGYRLNENQGVRSCEDIDECIDHDCGPNSKCINEVPGYYCECASGYNFTDGTCKPFCSGECQNGAKCTAPETCSCLPGFTGKYCQTDINECDVPNDCNHTNSFCVNTKGGYFCHCRKGYQKEIATNECEDVNECITGTHNCLNADLCINVIGGHFCKCHGGKLCPGQCMLGNMTLNDGESTILGCENCTCKDGKVTCVKEVCDCKSRDISNCVCCPHCKKGNICEIGNGKYIEAGEVYIEPGNRCNKMKCSERGVLTPVTVTCPSVDNCPANYIYTPVGSCCPKCQLPNCDGTNVGTTVDINCETATCDGASWSFKSITTCPSLKDCPKELIITLPNKCCPVCLQSCA